MEWKTLNDKFNQEKDLEGYEIYRIRDNGVIYNKKTKKVKTPWIDNTGYLQVLLHSNGKKTHKRLHRLVAENFLENPDNLPQINHIDGDKTNPDVSNLEWVSNKDNTQHGYDNGLYRSRNNIQVKVWDKYTGDYIGIFNSIRETSIKLGVNRKTLSAILFNNKTNNYKYIFEAVLDK